MDIDSPYFFENPKHQKLSEKFYWLRWNGRMNELVSEVERPKDELLVRKGNVYWNIHRNLSLNFAPVEFRFLLLDSYQVSLQWKIHETCSKVFYLPHNEL